MTASLIAWIVSIVFIVILVSGFFVGFWRGLRKSTFNLIVSIIGVIIAFFVAPVITKAILKIEVNYDNHSGTLNNMLVNMLLSNKDVDTMIKANPNLKVVIQNLPNALLTTVVFLLLVVAIECVVYLVYKILCLTLLRGKNGGRIFGGIAGLLKAFIVTVVAFMPLAGLIGLANNLTKSNDYGLTTISQTREAKKQGGLIKDNLPDGAIIVINGLENNFLTICSSMFGLDNAMFDYYSTIKVENGNIKLREEIENAYGIADFYYQIKKFELNNVDYTKIKYDRLIGYAEKLTKADLFKVVVATSLKDVIINYPKYSFLGENFKYNDILNEISSHLDSEKEASSYFRDDILNLLYSLKDAGETGLINEVLNLEDKSLTNISLILTSDENIETFENSLKGIFNLNLVRDGISSIMERAKNYISKDLDEIEIDGDMFDQTDWNEIATSFVKIIKDIGQISEQVDIGKVLSDVTVLLDKEKNYNISAIAEKLGSLIDELRANKLLRTAEDQPIVDKLFDKNDISLPKDEVVNKEGEKIRIENFRQLLKFLSPSLTAIRDEGIYEMFSDDSTTVAQKITLLANLLSEEGKGNLLGEILLPLYQIDFTNSLIIQEISKALGSLFVDMTLLTNYQEWESDLRQMSNMFVNLNSLMQGEETYLSLALNGNYDTIINNLSENDVDKVILPILAAKSTQPIKQKLIDGLATELDKITGRSNSLSTIGISFTGNDSQTEEVCQVIKKFIAVKNSINQGEKFVSANSELIGGLLEELKLNAFRDEGQGIFKQTFINMVEEYKEAYSKEVSLVEANPDLLKELDVNDLSEENYAKIDFLILANMIKSLQDKG